MDGMISAAMSENVPSDTMYVCPFVRSNQNLNWAHFGQPMTQSFHTRQPLRKKHLFKWIEIFTTKNRKFSDEISDIVHISAQNIDFGYSLEPPRRGGSNEYPQSMFLSRNKKNNVYPCKPQFYCIKVEFKGVKII